MQKARRHRTCLLRPLVSARFQVLFTPLFGVLFTFPSRYLFTIGLFLVFSLARWCWLFPTRRLRPRGTQDPVLGQSLTCTGFSPSLIDFPKSFHFTYFQLCQSYNPKLAVTSLVWALSLSLATTYEITIVFSSSAYLDVSVQRVCPP